jgi:hypothetical protein
LLGAVGFEAQQGIRELCHEREHLKDLQKDLAAVQGLVEAASQLQAGGARLAEVLQASGEAAASRAESLWALVQEVRELCEKRKLELRDEENKVVRENEIADAQHAEALKLLNTYKERLGLSITRLALQTVRIAFSLLDRSDEDREFHFTLGLCSSQDNADSSTQRYHVSECVPHVPELPQLLALLNEEASSAVGLPRFVCCMRRSFLKVSGNEACV